MNSTRSTPFILPVYSLRHTSVSYQIERRVISPFVDNRFATLGIKGGQFPMKSSGLSTARDTALMSYRQSGAA
jgi:hypothetical protein